MAHEPDNYIVNAKIKHLNEMTVFIELTGVLCELK